MIDISKYCSKSYARPALMYVEIKKDGEQLRATATDGARLISIIMPDILTDILPEGLYKAKDFKMICKIMNTKKSNINDVLLYKNSVVEIEEYPKWSQLLEGDMVSFEDHVKKFRGEGKYVGYNSDYFAEMVSDIGKIDKAHHFIINDLQCNNKKGGMLLYKKNGTIMCLMPLSL